MSLAPGSKKLLQKTSAYLKAKFTVYVLILLSQNCVVQYKAQEIIP